MTTITETDLLEAHLVHVCQRFPHMEPEERRYYEEWLPEELLFAIVVIHCDLWPDRLGSVMSDGEVLWCLQATPQQLMDWLRRQVAPFAEKIRDTT